jgi:hypothetical protein
MGMPPVQRLALTASLVLAAATAAAPPAAASPVAASPAAATRSAPAKPAAAGAPLKWARAQALDALPAGAPGGASVTLESVACTAPGSCVVVGHYLSMYTPHESAEVVPGSYESALPLAIAESHGRWGKPHAIALPANAASGRHQHAALVSVACPHTGACVAIGAYVTRSREQQTMVASQSRGAWSRARELALSGTTSAGTATVLLSSLACHTTRFCLAVGSSELSPSNPELPATSHPLAVTESDGTWGAPVEVPAPAAAPAPDSAALTSVACPASEACAAAGVYQVHPAASAPASFAGFVVGESGGAWGTSSTIAPSPKLRGVHSESLVSIACASSQACEAVGSYEDGFGIDHPLAVGETAGAWGAATPIALPTNASPGAGTSLEAVTCPALGACVAVGQYQTNSAAVVATAVVESGASWGPAAEIEPPPNAGAGPGLLEQLASVACPRPRSCVAVGGEIAVSTLP